MASCGVNGLDKTDKTLLYWVGTVGFGVLSLTLVAVLLWLARQAPAAALLLPAGVAAIPLMVWLFRRPLLNISVLLGGFVLIASHTDTLGLGEVLYGLYWATFMGHWFVTRVVIYHARIVPDVPSKALLLFLIGVILSAGLALFLGARTVEVVSQLRAVLMLAVFFPLREAVTRYRHALPLLLWVIAGTWCFIAVRNFLDYKSIIASALYTYQVARGRVISNDDILMSASTCLLTWGLFSSRWRERLWLLAAFMLCFGALLLTQSRSYWVSFAFTAFLLFLLVPARKRSVLLLATAGGLIGLTMLASVFMGDRFLLMMTGFVNRFGTISSATSADISLLSRYYEAKGAIAAFLRNPILGHGPGTTFVYWDILLHTTRETNFIHNGYVSLLFKHGIWGFVLVLTAWITTIVAGLEAYWTRRAQAATRVAGLAAALALSGFLLSQIAAPLLTLDDTTFNVAVLMALAAGARERSQLEAQA